MKLSITSILISSASIAIVSAQGTNKTLAPTPGIVTRPPVPPPITPFPTEPNVVSIFVYVVLQLVWTMLVWASVYHGYITNSQFMISCRCIDTAHCNAIPNGVHHCLLTPHLLSWYLSTVYHIFIRHHHQLHRHSFQHPQHRSWVCQS